MESNQITDILLESIQTLIDSSLKQIPIDETVVATITDASQRDQGIYKVTQNGQVIFEAYSEKTNYREKEQVLVLIPKNDIEKRQIISRYVTNIRNDAIAYVSEDQKLIQVTNNLIIRDTPAQTLLANSGKQYVQIAEINLDDNSQKICDTLYLKADFWSSFSDLSTLMNSGSYGILVNAFGGSGNAVAQWTLDSSMMFGNPYDFMAPFTQEIAFHYSDIEFNRLEVYFYQLDNFTYRNEQNEIVPVSSEYIGIGIDNKYNLQVSNVYLSFAYDLESIPDNTVKLFSDKLTYTTEDLTRKVSLVFYNKDENNRYLPIGEGEHQWDVEEAKKLRGTISYVIESEKDNKKQITYRISGVTPSLTKEQDTPEYKEGDLVYYSISNKDGYDVLDIIGKIDEDKLGKYHYAVEYYQQDSKGNWSSNTIAKQEFDIKCQDTLVQTKTYAIVWCNGEQYKSNELVFENTSALNKAGIDLAGIELYFEHGANSKDNYNIYDGMTNSLYEPTEAQRDRELVLKYKSDSEIGAEFWKGAKVEWSFPGGPSMLVDPRTEEEKKEVDLILEENGFTPPKITYRIKPNYYAGLNNNVISCVVSILMPDESYAKLKAEKSFGFSTFGASGTDYTIVFKDNTESKEISASVSDKDGNTVSFDVSMRWMGDENWSSSINYKDRNSTTYNMIEAKAQVEFNGNNVWIYGYHGVIIGNKEITVPSSILYDNQGVNPIYYKGDWFPSGGEWNVHYYGYTDETIVPQELPRIIDGKFIVPNMYVKPEGYCAIEFKDSENNITNIPVYIGQNQYQSELLNNWDGALQIDKDGNYILSAMLGAGVKNNDNTFTGVVMGERKILDENNKETRDSGLFGFAEGVQTFEFNTNGTATLGTTSGGQIKFNGTDGVIQSGNYIAKESGMKIDLKEGTIDSKNFRLDINGTAILGATSTGQIKFDGTSGIIQSGNNTGMSIDLTQGIITSEKFKLDSTNIKLNSNPGDGENYIEIGNKALTFDKNNALSVTGKIIAQSGEIGGWRISEEGDSAKAGALVKDYVVEIEGKDKWKGKFVIQPNNMGTDNGVIFCQYDGKINFLVTGQGILHASGATVSGNVTANSISVTGFSASSKGVSIGGWTVNGNTLYSKNGDYAIAMCSSEVGTTDRWFAVGEFNPTSPSWGDKVVFSINGKGGLVATDATIEGDISGCTISSSKGLEFLSGFNNVPSVFIQNTGGGGLALRKGSISGDYADLYVHNVYYSGNFIKNTEPK